MGLVRDTAHIVVVSGVPRSGTSMMMRMLKEGRHPVLVDQRRPADAHNPHGYFEYTPVKGSAQNTEWVEQAKGRAVKVIDALLPTLPTTHAYRVIFMERDPHAIASSQMRMLDHDAPPSDLTEGYTARLAKVWAWATRRPNVKLLRVSYERVLQEPRACAERVTGYLDVPLDIEKMVEAVVVPEPKRPKT